MDQFGRNVFCLVLLCHGVDSNPHVKLLYEYLTTGYNKLIRPATQNNATLTVRFKLKLSQLIDVHEKNQIMTTNVWLKQEWTDYKLQWDPKDYGGVSFVHMPADQIWQPDIVLYNNADGKYQVSIMTKALVYWNGTVIWEPPAIYKSMCQINVKWFPFDEQSCDMKFGSWTYDGNEVDLVFFDNSTDAYDNGKPIQLVKEAIDLSELYPSAVFFSVEWDIMEVPGKRHQERYSCCPAVYVDITYEINLRRKTLFYTVNLIIPCVCISFLTVLVFYLPSDSGEKVSLSISILISLTVFFLLLVEIIPSTSLVIPLVAKYLLFTMVMVTLSIAVTVITLNVHFRSPNTHTMPGWVRDLFLRRLPPLLLMRRPQRIEEEAQTNKTSDADLLFRNQYNRMERYSRGSARPSFLLPIERSSMTGSAESSFMSGMGSSFHRSHSSESDHEGSATHYTNRTRSFLRSAVESACLIAEHLRNKDKDEETTEDWRFVALVLDRLFLYIFSTTCLVATFGLLLQAPIIFDKRTPLKQ